MKMLWMTRKMRRDQLKNNFGNNPLESDEIFRINNRMDEIKIYHEELSEYVEESVIDTITWNDLEMDSVFKRINHTKSYIGEQVLYHRLHQIDVKGEQDQSTFEKHISFFLKNEEARIRIEEKLQRIGKRMDHYHMPTFLIHSEFCVMEHSFLFPILQILLVLFLLGSVILHQVLFIVGLIMTAGVNLFIYMTMKQKYEVLFESLGNLKRIISFSKWLISDKRFKDTFGNFHTGNENVNNSFVDQKIVDAVHNLDGVAKKIYGLQTRNVSSMSGDVLGILSDYVMGITLIDVVAYNHIMKVIEHKQDNVLQLYEFVGNVDMEISVASYRSSLDQWCMPEFHDAHKIVTEGIAHPLLTDPVLNDMTLNDRAIITGANASGKSTFMKAMAINAILAQTIYTCTAKSFNMTRSYIMTSMSLKDDVLSGESYYIRETKYLKRMLDQTQKEVPTLCVIDEILKGTNTKERIAASLAILTYLAQGNSFILIATHDMELVEELKNQYESFYFESIITDENIYFDYQIRKGYGGKSNAVALLSLLEFPKEVVALAEYNKNRISG